MDLHHLLFAGLPALPIPDLQEKAVESLWFFGGRVEILSPESAKQFLRFFEICGIETLGEPAIDWRE
jgi:hypothetical protein